MFTLTLSLFVVKLVVCEWVEIVPISKNISEKSLYTTTQAYEVSIKNPFSSDYPTDLKPHSSLNIEQKNVTQTNVGKQIQENLNFTKEEFDTETENEEEDDDEYEEDSGENESSVGMNSFMDFLKSAQKTLLQYKMNSYRSKMSVLKHLRDMLTLNIHEKIAHFKFAHGNSEARGYKEEEHQMDHSSNEAALMTIGFLTFSVFLIKLVIKLVHLLKYKQQYYYGMNTMSTTTPATVVFLKRKGRMEDEHDITRILEYTEHLKN